MQLQKSEKARTELGAKVRLLGIRERAALLLADGHKTRTEVQRLLQDDGSLLQKLIADGYLLQPSNGAAVLIPAANEATVQASRPSTVPATPRSSSDSFGGKRSLATTRMFLFDLCERMFANKTPALAEQFRDQLREAGDRESMLLISRAMISRVEEIAGPERADGLSERIAMLLPSQH